ncbi:MAG TPA: hypothetical protein VGF94_17070 [Kofleriaceae bacterium]|jgi:hypothetical protein
MSPLAKTIYKQLLRRARSHAPSITYAELAGGLGARSVHHRSPAFHAALGELANTCRHRQLPCLPAMVWRADTRRPSDGYYKVAHPRAHTEPARIAAWEREHARVIAELASFPPAL